MIELPPIISRRDFPTDEEIIKEAYRIFLRDFIQFPPKFRAQTVQTRKEMMANNYNKTFWHIITEGDHRESDNIIQDRLERIPWINPIIEGQPDNAWYVWTESGNGRCGKNRERIHIYSSQMRYLIVIERDLKTDKDVFWTAYPIKENHTDRNLIKRYKKANKDL